MILNRNIVYDLTVGDPARSPEEGDNNVQVPNMILPVVLALRSHETVFSATALFQGSGVSEASITATNGAGQSAQIITLAPGLWEIEISMSSWFNYNKVAADFNGTSVIFNYQGITRTILKRYAAQNLSATDYGRFRVLLSSVGALHLVTSAVAVGQSVDVQAVVNAIRIL